MATNGRKSLNKLNTNNIINSSNKYTQEAESYKFIIEKEKIFITLALRFW